MQEAGGPTVVCVNLVLLKRSLVSQVITPLTGMGVVRVRIEEVSRNHQHQDFKVVVAPATGMPLLGDIGECVSPPFTVLSRGGGALL